jgi:hypothetical protein
MYLSPRYPGLAKTASQLHKVRHRAKSGPTMTSFVPVFTT